MVPEAFGQELGSADDPVLVCVGINVDHAEDFQDAVREIGDPAAGAEPDLAEGLAVFEGKGGDGLGCGQVAREGDVVEARHQLVPESLDGGQVAGADGFLHGARVFLELGRLVATADRLACHRTTVGNRLSAFENYTGLDLQKPRDAALALIAVGA
jgi:hypothetical protein